jgi:hypothetical protein
MAFPSSNELKRLQTRRDELAAAMAQAVVFYQAKAAEMREVRAQLAAVDLDVDMSLRASLYDRQRVLADTVSAAMIKANALRRQLADLDDAIDAVKAKVRSLDRLLAARRVELGPDGYYTMLVDEARARLEQAQSARRKAEAEVEALLKDRRQLAPDDFES